MFIANVRLGIRAQLVLALAALLLLAFGPLFLATASLTRASLSMTASSQARLLGEAVAGRLQEARIHRDDAALQPLLKEQLRLVAAVAIYDGAGQRLHVHGPATLTPLLPEQAPSNDVSDLQAPHLQVPQGERVLRVVETGAQGSTAVIVSIRSQQPRFVALMKLVALYTGLLAVALLVFLYFVLTRIVVTPVEQLSQAAERVAGGARELPVPRGGGRELLALGASLSAMTNTLRNEEEQLRDKVKALKAAADNLQHAQNTLVRSERLASVGKLASGLAHEIGNPIAAILSIQELLLDDDLSDEQRDFLQRMNRETERVHRILRDLLDFARPAARRGSSAKEDDVPASASITEAIDHVVSLVQPQQSFRDLRLDVTVEEGLPAVAMHAERIEQVLLNLMLNAAYVVPPKSGHIALSASVENGADEGQRVVRVCVEDNGGGIDPSVRDQLFEPFVTTKDVGEGTGLGLAVCRGLMEAAGGSIDAEDARDGARFVLLFKTAETNIL